MRCDQTMVHDKGCVSGGVRIFLRRECMRKNCRKMMQSTDFKARNSADETTSYRLPADNIVVKIDRLMHLDDSYRKVAELGE